MMREALSQWDYVIAVPAIAALIVFSWLRMRRAERARDAARKKGRGE